MGAGSSSPQRRTYSEENAAADNIQLSPEVVARLLEAQKHKDDLPSKPASSPPPAPAASTIPSTAVEKQDVASNTVVSVDQASSHPYPEEISLALHRLKEEQRENEAKIEQHFRKKMEYMQNEFVRTHHLVNSEFERVAKETANRLPKPDDKPICGNMQTQVQECLEKNRKRPLLCQRLVTNFLDCVTTLSVESAAS